MCTRFNLWKRIVPEIVPNRLVLCAFSVLAFFSGRIKDEIRKNHFYENIEILEKGKNVFFKEREYVENQNLWGNVRFGSHKKSNMAYSGCGIIATYNAIISMGGSELMSELIKVFEKNGIALKGGFGIAPAFPARYFKKKGYLVKRLTSRKKERINEFGKENETFLLTFYWDKSDITRQLHTVNISKNGENYYVHNAYHLETDDRFGALGPYGSLYEAIRALGERVTPIVIYGINKK